MNNPKYFICPMSKIIVDTIKELDNRFALLPTRRQIDWDGGYVNNWDTKSFYEYVRKDSNVLLERDHSGPSQGKVDDDGFESYKEDSKYFDLIHIDPWKKHQSFKEGVDKTIEVIKFIYELNPKVKYEIATEEAIRKFSIEEVDEFIETLKRELTGDMFNNIEYFVIQSGVHLDLVEMKNVGNFNLGNLKLMVDHIRKHNIKTKEHNGDYLTNEEYVVRFDNGLDSINIGPEIAQIQTLIYLNHMSEKQIDEYYQICLDSKKWERWVKKDFNFDDKKKLIQVCGHYCYDQYELPNVDSIIKETLINKFKSLP
jgi:hypothetical protein